MLIFRSLTLYPVDDCLIADARERRLRSTENQARVVTTALIHGPTAALVTELLQLSAPDHGTVYHHVSEMRTYRTVCFSGH